MQRVLFPGNVTLAGFRIYDMEPTTQPSPNALFHKDGSGLVCAVLYQLEIQQADISQREGSSFPNDEHEVLRFCCSYNIPIASLRLKLACSWVQRRYTINYLIAAPTPNFHILNRKELRWDHQINTFLASNHCVAPWNKMEVLSPAFLSSKSSLQKANLSHCIFPKQSFSFNLSELSYTKTGF